jgi:uncharacterized protein YigE (DUF2233 family)
VLSIDRRGEAKLSHTREWKGGPSVEFAVQAGPRLVVDGEILTFKPNFARRSALCVPSPGKITLVATAGPVVLDDFAAFLAADVASGGLGCRDALNLDGGPSTQLHVDRAGSPVGVQGRDEVPVFVGVFARGAATPGPGRTPGAPPTRGD